MGGRKTEVKQGVIQQEKPAGREPIPEVKQCPFCTKWFKVGCFKPVVTLTTGDNGRVQKITKDACPACYNNFERGIGVTPSPYEIVMAAITSELIKGWKK